MGQEVLRVADCDIGLFYDCLYFRPYAAIGSYHKVVISIPKGITTLFATGCTILSARSTMMVSSYTGLEVQSTVDCFTERASDTAVYAASLVPEPEASDFSDEGDAVPASSPLSARAATMVDAMDVTPLVKAAQPQYISVAGCLC